MNHPQNEAAVMDSWRRCAQAGLRPDSGETLYPLPPQALQELAERHRSVISAFERCASPAAASLPRASAFLLMDGRGVLLKKNTRPSALSDVRTGVLLRGDPRWDQRRRAVPPNEGAGLDGSAEELLLPSGRMCPL